MKRFNLVVTAVTLLCAGTLFGSPPPTRTPRPTRTPTPTPTPTHAGPTLELTFSGITVFLKKGNGYRVIVPASNTQKHVPYMLYQKEGAKASDFDVSEFQCDFKNWQWGALTADALTIDPPTAIDAGPLNADRLDGWLVHLHDDLEKANVFNESDYDNDPPKIGFVAAQMDIGLGTLKPFILPQPHHPVKWELKTENGSQSSGVRVCGVSGITWVVPLKKDTTEISLVSSLRPGRKFTFAVRNGQTRSVIIGNALAEDIDCPTKLLTPIDHHFKTYYKMLKTPVATEYIPVRVKPDQKCPTPTGAQAGSRSLRGSNCIGSQWP